MADHYCDDCGTSDRHNQQVVPNFSSAITLDGQSRLYCEFCRRRRGVIYLFDPRSWAAICTAMKGSAA